MRASVALLAACLAPGAGAALAVVGTRFIYPGDGSRLTVATRNLGDAPILVQTWIDDGRADVDPSVLRAPFMVVPPVARVEPHQSLALRVQSSGDALAQDRESRFWINLLEIPPAGASSDHMLRIVYRLRMKLLYRPPHLDGAPDEAPGRLRWTRDAQARARLSAFNPTPYYVTLTRVSWRGAPLALAGGALDIAPFARADLPLDERAGPEDGELLFDAVGDDGTQREYRGRLEPP